jgi:hydrogenase nickel incorporation protein HypA/HybF
MHEMSLALNIVDLAVETAGKEGGERVSEVEIEVGNMAGVMADALQFCLEAVARTTIVEGAAFNLVESSAIGECPSCRSTFKTASFYPVCPDCGQEGVPVSGGQDLRIISLTIEE